MMQMKMGGLVLTGIGAYLIFSKGFQLIDRAVNRITEAQKWKAYYKACGNNQEDIEKILPPHYMQTCTHPNGDAETIHPEGWSPEEKAQKNTSQEALKGSITNAINKTVNALFDAKKAVKTPPEVIQGAIYVIDENEFYNQCPHYDKVIACWYIKDDILCDEATGDIIESRKTYLGTDDLGWLFHEFQHEDPDVIYIRNDDDAMDLEITRLNKAYKDVLIEDDNIVPINAPKAQDTMAEDKNPTD